MRASTVCLPPGSLRRSLANKLTFRPSITFPYGGIKINTKAEALDSDGSPIPALYVAGVDAGGFSNGHYAGGLSVAFITGQWAGKNAAAWSKRQGVKMNGDV
jgi:predicted oxidoreductase